jgi:hypothetical protein
MNQITALSRQVPSARAISYALIIRLRVWNQNQSARPGGRFFVGMVDPLDAGLKGVMNFPPV